VASVHQHPKSDFWQCNFKAWDQKRGWVRVAKSTGIPLSRSKKRAQAIADEFEKAAIAMGPDNPDRHNREFYERVIGELCILAGVKNERPPITWSEWRRRWESEQQVSEISRKSYKLALDLFEEYAKLGEETLLSEITKAKLRGFRKFLDKQKLSERTVQARWTTLKRVLKRAHTEGYLQENPMDGIKD